MPQTERQRTLLAVLTARGPASPCYLSHHPVLEDEYESWLEIEDELDDLVAQGCIRALYATKDHFFPFAYDIPQTDRDAYVERNRPDHITVIPESEW